MDKIIQSNKYFWYAVYVKSRSEKKSQLELQVKGIETFLPIQRKLRQWSDRKKWVEIPLISGYLFLRISRKEYYLALESNNIVSYVRFDGKASVIPDCQIEYLKLLLKQYNLEIEITREKLEPGQMIEVVRGPLIGLRGKLIKIKGKDKVAIELEDLGYSALVDILAEDINIFSDNPVLIT